MIKFYSKRTLLKKNIRFGEDQFQKSHRVSSMIGRIVKVSPIATHFVPVQDLAFW